MKSIYKIAFYILAFLASGKQFAQHHSQLSVEVNLEHKTLNIQQEITFFNQSNDSFLTQNGEVYTLSHGWITCTEYQQNKEKYTLHERKLKV